MHRAVVLLVGALAVVGCRSEPDASLGSPPSPAPPRATAEVAPDAPRPLEAEVDAVLAERGKALVSSYQCNRCHDIDGVEPPELDFDCAGCHQKILAGDFDATPEELAQWQGRLHSLDEVPSLTRTDRLSRRWVESFVPDAHDVRPNLLASMPRFSMPEPDAEAIAAFLVPSAEPTRPTFGDANRGRALLESKGCASCHRMSGVPSLAANPTPEPLPAVVFARGQKMAPDLRHARDRLRPASLVAWIVDPQAIKPDAVMPALGVTPAEANDIAAYLVEAQLEPVPVQDVPTLPALLEREVTYAEVHERIFGKICRHCHSDPDVVIGDGGPGYDGGFGFPQRRLDLSTYEGLRSGSKDDAGKRRSVFKPVGDDGPPRIVAHLLARHAEVAGAPVDGVRGMPLGLPPLPMDDIVLLATWIEQGRKKSPSSSALAQSASGPGPEPLRVVDIEPSAGPLKQQLRMYGRRGAKRSQRVVLEMGAPWCPPCKRAKALLAEASVASQLDDVVVLRVDSDRWGDELDALGFDSPVIPAYYRLDGEGGPSGMTIRGDRWKTRAQVREGLLAFLTGP